MKPFFSIVIPTYNRQKQLVPCLHSISSMNYPRSRFEVIVVDDGSEMPVEAAIQPFYTQINLTLLRQSNAGPAKARNSGAMSAKGEFIAFIDDDCRPAPDWLGQLVSHFGVFPDHAIGGITINRLSKNLYSTASQLHVDYLYSYYNKDPKNAVFFSSMNLALKTSLFHEVGGFDNSFITGEDREFCYRWKRYGYKMLYTPEVVVYHAHKLTLNSFWWQHYNYGRGAFRLRSNLAYCSKGSLKLEPKSFYLNLLLYPYLNAVGWRKLLFMILMMVSQLANMAGFLREWITQRIRKFRRLA